MDKTALDFYQKRAILSGFYFSVNVKQMNEMRRNDVQADMVPGDGPASHYESAR